MSERDERLVQVHQAADQWEGALLVGFLQDNGIEANLREPASVPPLDSAERLMGGKKTLGILVLEHEAERARALLAEFQAAETDEGLLEDAATRNPTVDRAKIHALKTQLREERKTFETLGWLAIVFCGAAALLWVIWPSWLKAALPPSGLRWVMVIVFTLAAVFVGGWLGKRMR